MEKESAGKFHSPQRNQGFNVQTQNASRLTMPPPTFQLSASDADLESESEESAMQLKAGGGMDLAGSPGDDGDSLSTGLERLGGMDAPQLKRSVGQRKAVQRQAAPVQRSASDAAPKGPVQRLAVQVHESEAGRIGELQIAGRPKSVYSDSMGDHTTAFAVHAEGLKKQLEGQTYAQAMVILDGMRQGLQALPGWALQGNLPDGQKDRLAAVLQQLDAVLAVGSSSGATHSSSASMAAASPSPSPAAFEMEEKKGGAADQSQQLDLVQKAVHLYLDARELIPLSTLNIRAKSASGGKGKGEGRYIDVLRNYRPKSSSSSAAASSSSSSSVAAGPSEEDVVLAIEGLFDFTSTAIVMVETDPGMMNQMAPGMVNQDTAAIVEDNPKKRIEEVWKQHLQSIKASFPDLAHIADSDLLVKKFEQEDVLNTVQIKAVEDHEFVDRRFNTALSELAGFIEIFDNTSWGNTHFGTRANFFIALATYGADADEMQFGDCLKRYQRVQMKKEECEGFKERLDAIEKMLEAIGSEEVGSMQALRAERFLNVWTLAGEDLQNGVPLPAESESGDMALEETEELDHKEDTSGSAMDSGDIVEESVSTSSSSSSSNAGKKKRKAPSAPTRKSPRVAEVAASASLGNKTHKVDAETKGGRRAKPKKIGYKPQGKVQTEEQVARGDFGLQITLDGTGKISDVVTDGRTLSPFTGTMGAHTIAWVLHTEHFKAALVGRTLDQALAAAVDHLYGFVLEMDQGFDPHGGRGNAAQKSRKKGALAVRVDAMSKQIKSGKVTGSKLSFLQTFLSNLLAYSNLIPGMTHRANNTNGRGEPAAKKALEDHQSGATRLTADQLMAHVRKLREPKGGNDVCHFQEKMIDETYPEVGKTIRAAGRAFPVALIVPDEESEDEESEDEFTGMDTAPTTPTAASHSASPSAEDSTTEEAD